MSEMLQTSKESPTVKEGEILLVKQEDGNWRGYMIKEGQPIETRQIDPYTALISLLTHG